MMWKTESVQKKTEKQVAFDVNAVLFDFDGVIINSAADIADAINAMLVRFKLHPLEEQTVTEFIGDGVRNLVLRAVRMSNKNSFSEISVEKLEEMVSWYQTYYYNHATEKTTVYQYVPEVLETLYMLGKRAAVVSNKPKKITEEILDYFDLEYYFDTVVGPEQLKAMKPDPEGIALAVRQINQCNAGNDYFSKITKPSEVLMIGDSAQDIKAGHSYGAKTCGFLYGLGNTQKMQAENPDIVISNIKELLAHIV